MLDFLKFGNHYRFLKLISNFLTLIKKISSFRDYRFIFNKSKILRNLSIKVKKYNYVSN